MSKINDIDLKQWKNYEDIITDSLWIMNTRDDSGEHKGDYHGNFIPQIPYQLLTRYTKKDDWILDPFLGSGTSLIEAKRLGRNGIGLDVDENMIEISRERVNRTEGNNKYIFAVGDSQKYDIEKLLEKEKIKKVQFAIFHPPYWDIIKFNDKEGNLALTNTLEEFLSSFERVIDNTLQHLEDDRYFAIVIGDMYKNSEWIPLSSHIIQLLLNKGYILKSSVVKNMGETRAKSNNKAIWRYRALAFGFYVFSHEYILIFKKNKQIKKQAK